MNWNKSNDRLSNYYDNQKAYNNQLKEKVIERNELFEKSINPNQLFSFDSGYNSINYFNNANGFLPYNLLESVFKGQVANCIRLKCKYAAGSKFVLKRRVNQTQSIEVTRHSALKFINLLNNPNPLTTGHTFTQQTLENLEVYGDAFIYAITGKEPIPNTNIYEPLELWNIPAREMKIKQNDNNGFPLGYERTLNGRTTSYKLNDVIHPYYSNPFHPFKGLSTIQLGWDTIQIYNKIIEWQTSLMKNNATLSLFFTVEGNLPDKQKEYLNQQIRENLSGANNQRKSMIGTNGMKVTEYGINPKELDMLGSLEFYKNEIMNIFGVHVGMTDAKNVNKANIETAVIIFNHMTIKSMLDHLASAYTLYLSKTYNDSTLFVDSELDLPDSPVEMRNNFETASALAADTKDPAISEMVLNEFLTYMEYDNVDELRSKYNKPVNTLTQSITGA